MHERVGKSRPVHEKLDTAYVNLAALLRHLRQRDFAGHIHIELDEYEAYIYIEGSVGEPRVREINHATGKQAEGTDALQRLLVRASEAGGRIDVYESVDEEETTAESSSSSVMDAGGGEAESDDEQSGGTSEPGAGDWSGLMSVSGDLIAAIERATLSFGKDFNTMFRAARLEQADDFPFLDPATERLRYSHGLVSLNAQPSAQAYVLGLSECLRRVVDKLAQSAHQRSVRERVALELAVVARRRDGLMKRFNLTSHLDRIAGTRVL